MSFIYCSAGVSFLIFCFLQILFISLVYKLRLKRVTVFLSGVSRKPNMTFFFVRIDDISWPLNEKRRYHMTAPKGKDRMNDTLTQQTNKRTKGQTNE